ncbi:MULTISPECIES: hypothetical protein, partial [unclassified Synechococcus]|uniref:hypothetical protein n=1 Tax=unclassified Synechococcus TaxID=2626047 RepID=UPI000AAED290
SDRHERERVRISAGCGIPGDLNNFSEGCGGKSIHLKPLVSEHFLGVSSALIAAFVAVPQNVATRAASEVTMGAASGL